MPNKNANTAIAHRPIRLFVASALPDIGDIFAKPLYFERDIEVIGAANSAQELFEKVKLHTPDIILIDVLLSDIDGFQAVKLLFELMPMQVIMFSVCFETEYIKEYVEDALRLGVKGYLPFLWSTEDLTFMVYKVAQAPSTYH